MKKYFAQLRPLERRLAGFFVPLRVQFAPIETGAFFRVRQQIVGGVEFLKPLGRPGVAGMQVRVMPLGEFSKRRFDRRVVRRV